MVQENCIYSLEELSSASGLSLRYLGDLIRAGTLPAGKVGKRYFVRGEAFAALVIQQTKAAKKQAKKQA